MPLIPDLNPNIPGRVTPVAPDVGTAMAPGIAMAKVGAGIADAGEVAGRIQLRYQAARDQDAKNMARMWAQEAYSKNLAYRAENPDETTWKANLDENLGELRARVQELKLSPFAREELTAELDGWASESNSKLMLESVNHRIARGRSTYQALDEQYRKAGDNESRLRLLDENTGTLYHPEEAAVMRRQIEQDREEWEKKSRQTAAELEIMRDPTSPLLAQKYASTQPPEGADEAEYQDARQFWLQARTQAQHRFINDIRDRIATNDPDKKIRTPDELKIYEDEIGADAVAALQDGMKKSRDAAYKEWSALPENQALLVGQITAQLESLKDDDLVARVILEQQLDAVAEGPSKNYLREEIARKIRGEAPQAADTILKAGMEALKNAADLGDFGPVKPPAAKPVETRNALKAGWLKDI
ncbi:MAG: hypothetical protein MUC40_00625, partial [Akkermansiaceae bacterium]|nr:hypothetical protein [Akkermansiaceae bacterium]